jgi:hypothetical protein
MALTVSHKISENADRCTELVYLLGVAPDSRTKSPKELIWESNFAITPNVDSFSLLIQEFQIRFILFLIIFLYCA